jgi:hypothetical protein
VLHLSVHPVCPLLNLCMSFAEPFLQPLARRIESESAVADRKRNLAVPQRLPGYHSNGLGQRLAPALTALLRLRVMLRLLAPPSPHLAAHSGGTEA